MYFLGDIQYCMGGVYEPTHQFSLVNKKKNNQTQ